MEASLDDRVLRGAVNCVFTSRDENHITIWRFEDAPALLRRLSNNGNEDWLVWIPRSFGEEFCPLWIGNMDMDENPQKIILRYKDEFLGIVYIGSH